LIIREYNMEETTTTYEKIGGEAAVGKLCVDHHRASQPNLWRDRSPRPVDQRDPGSHSVCAWRGTAPSPARLHGLKLKQLFVAI
jgi:hypothetical protein